MSDDATYGPTPAQLQAANLVAVNTWEEIDASIINEQGPLRTWNARAQDFPPVTSGYVTAPKPVNPPPPPPPPSSTYEFGINDHFLMWSAPSAYPIAIMQKLGVKVCRNDLILTYDPTNITSKVQTWAGMLRTAGIQPMVVVTFSTLPDTTTFAAQMGALAAACPGVWWEIGNEIEAPGAIPATSYVPFFAATVKAMQASDPTCKVGPSPVSNINGGGGGWNYTQGMFTAGLAAIPYDFIPFHWYQYPGNIPPNVSFYWGATTPPLFFDDISIWTKQLAAWGNTKPAWLTEFGYESLTTSSKDPGTAFPEMTEALQSQYILEELTAFTNYDIPVVLAYSLADAGQTYGWYTSGWVTPKAVAAAIQTLAKG